MALTKEQIRIYNDNAVKRGLTPIKDTPNNLDTFSNLYSEVLPYTTGLHAPVVAKQNVDGTINTDDFEKNIQDNLNDISNATQYLFNAIDAAKDGYDTAIDAATTAGDAQQTANDAQQTADEGYDAAIQAGQDALAAQTTANAAQEQVNAQVAEIAQAQTDATQALLDASSAAGIATSAGETAATAITNAATAQAAAEAAQTDAINANSAAIAAQAAATDAATQTIVTDGKSTSNNTAMFTILTASPQAKIINVLCPISFKDSGGGDTTTIGFTANGVLLNARMSTSYVSVNGDGTSGHNENSFGEWTTNIAPQFNSYSNSGMQIQVPANFSGGVILTGNALNSVSFEAGYIELLPTATLFTI